MRLRSMLAGAALAVALSGCAPKTESHSARRKAVMESFAARQEYSAKSLVGLKDPYQYWGRREFSENAVTFPGSVSMRDGNFRYFALTLDPNAAKGVLDERYAVALFDTRALEESVDPFPWMGQSTIWKPPVSKKDRERPIFTKNDMRDSCTWGGIPGMQVFLSPEAGRLYNKDSAEYNKYFRRIVDRYFNPEYQRVLLKEGSQEAEWLKEGSYHELLPEKPPPLEIRPTRVKVRRK